MSSSFTVGLVQESVANDVQRNVDRAVARVREAADRGAQIVCLQELFNAPYFCKSQKHERFDLAEPIPGPTIERMQKMARELEMVIIVPIFERQAAGVYRNSAGVVDADGTLLGAYRKMHIPGDAQVEARRTAQRAHAIANGVYVASTNRVGHEDEPGTDGIEFFGHSFISDPFGRILAEAGTEPAVLVAKCDRALIENTRRNWP